MFSDQEKKLIKRYCLLPILAKAFLVVALLIGIVWGLLVMINDMVFNGDLYMLGIYTYLGIVVIYVIAFIVCFSIPRMGMKKEKWQQIIEKANIEMSKKDYSSQIAAVLGAKGVSRLLSMSDNPKANQAGDVMDVLSAAGALITVTQMTNELSNNARLAAAVCGVKIPKARKHILLIVFLPIILLIAVYIPQYISSKQITDRQAEVAAKSVYALQSALEKDCDRVSINDPKEGYRSSGYQVTGYLYDYDNPRNAYIYITVGNDGVINEVNYCVDVDIQADKEENLEKAELDILKLNVMMNDSDVKAASNELLEEYTLPEEFKIQFQEISYYESFIYRKSETVSVNYMTDPEDEYDEYSESNIYFSVEGSDPTPENRENL